MSKRFRRIAALSVAGAVVAGGAGTAYAAMSSPGPAYRLATATSADVTAALHVVGTLTPVRQADVAFPVDGTVASVAVRPGQHVTAGQTLGSLGMMPLKADLTAAQSILANANLQVDNDTASQNAATTTPSTSPASQPAPSVRPLQQAVLGAQRQVDSALARAKAALSQARHACTPSPSPSPSPSPTTRPSVTATATKAATATPAATGTSQPATVPAPAACAAATQRVLNAETAALQAQQALSGQLTTLNTALSRAAATASKSAGGGGGGAGGSTVRGSGRGGGSAGPVSAAQLAADQASADAAAAQVTVAQANLADATVVSPIDGTVVTASVAPGASAAAGSTAFVIAGLGSYQVVTTVPVADLPDLKVGQRASVQPDGTSSPLSGSVALIGLVPASSGSPVTYSVTISLPGPPTGLHAGGYANVTIITAQGSGVSVPTSAVHGSGHSATVTVYAGGKTKVTRVKVGTRGPVMTQITSGLTIGQRVVLADLSQSLPTNNLNNQFPGPGGGPGLGGPGKISFQAG
jgi:multidrug efflux pump subunit AcrA (membrane-fusion protein)